MYLLQQEPAATVHYLQQQHNQHRSGVFEAHTLSAVVTQTNAMLSNRAEGRQGRLYQAVAYHRRMFSPHRPAPAGGVTLANGHIAPGQRSGPTRPQSGAASVADTAYHTPPLPHHNYVHTTQRVLAPVAGSKVYFYT